MAFLPHGTTFSFNNRVVAELSEITGPSISVDDVEVTSHDSNFWKEFLPGLIEGGEISFTGNYVPSDAGQIALRGAIVGRTVGVWKILYPNGYGWTGDGYFTSFEVTAPHEEKSEISMTIKTTGAISEVTPS